MNDNKLLVVYNTCGLSGRDNYPYYKHALDSILNQDFMPMRVVFSDCMGLPQVRESIQKEYGKEISYNFIDEVLPVNVTFNHSILRGIKEFGEFDGYLYVDSGVRLLKDNQIDLLYELLKSDNYGMVSARVDDDSGVFVNFGLGKHEGDQSQEYKLFDDGDFIMPVGKALNLHLQIFANCLQRYYNRCIPDIFAGWATESVFTFLCSAIQINWIVSKDVIVHHYQGVDGQSSGFNPHIWQQHNDPFNHPFIIDSIYKVFNNQLAKGLGLGYLECLNKVIHDESQYRNNLCTNTYLKQYIKNNLFLSSQQFNYQKIKHIWIK